MRPEAVLVLLRLAVGLVVVGGGGDASATAAAAWHAPLEVNEIEEEQTERLRAWLCPVDCAAWLRGYRSRRHPLCRLWVSAGRLLAPPTAPAALAETAAPANLAALAPPDPPDSLDSLSDVRSQLAGLHLGASRSISHVRCELARLRDALRAAQPPSTDPLDTSPLHPEAVAVEVMVSAVARRLFARLARGGGGDSVGDGGGVGDGEGGGGGGNGADGNRGGDGAPAAAEGDEMAKAAEAVEAVAVAAMAEAAAVAAEAEDRASYLHREPPRTWCDQPQP